MQPQNYHFNQIKPKKMKEAPSLGHPSKIRKLQTETCVSKCAQFRYTKTVSADGQEKSFADSTVQHVVEHAEQNEAQKEMIINYIWI